MSNIDRKHLVEARNRCGYSQKYVSLSIGVAPSTVSQWETGFKNPSRESIGKLADLYGVSIDYLMGREEDAQQKSPPTLAEDELDWELLTLIRQLSPEKKKLLVEFLRQR